MTSAVEMRRIVKDFPLTRALDQVDFTLRKGSIHSLLGENGAGKSTLMNILYGLLRADQGSITLDGRAVRLTHPRVAMAHGIGMVHQHFMLAPVLSVAENIVVGDEPGKGLFFNRRNAEQMIDEIILRYGFRISASTVVKNLSVGEQQRVEIVKAVYRKANILILDEPTAVLTPNEVEELFTIMRGLRDAGTSIILITHKLRETLAIADTVSVLRDGRMVESNLPSQDVKAEELAHMMVGRDIDLERTNPGKKIGSVALSVQELRAVKNGQVVLTDLSFELKKGEILGIAGVEGNGQTELIEVLTGLRSPVSAVMVKGNIQVPDNPRSCIDCGIGHVPEDRSTRGLIKDLSVEDNLILGYHRRPEFNRQGFFRRNQVRQYAERLIKSYGIKTAGPKERCSALSGGNQQKVVIARVFTQDPDVIIVAQPTRGVDIGAMEYIHTRLFELRDEGKAILLISADLDEVLQMSDRIAVLYAGRLVSFSRPGEYTETELGLLMTGSSLQRSKDHV